MLLQESGVDKGQQQVGDRGRGTCAPCPGGQVRLHHPVDKGVPGGQPHHVKVQGLQHAVRRYAGRNENKTPGVTYQTEILSRQLHGNATRGLWGGGGVGEEEPSVEVRVGDAPTFGGI